MADTMLSEGGHRGGIRKYIVNTGGVIASEMTEKICTRKCFA
jgi:hypothetical protein